MKKAIAAIVGPLALAAAVGLGVDDAHAWQTRSISTNPGQITYDDVGITGGGSLRATLTLNGLGSGQDITVATSGWFQNQLTTTCINGAVQANSVFGNETVWSDLTHLCAPFVSASSTTGVIDDL